MSLKDNTKRKNIKTKTKNLPKTKGGKAIASGGFGCVFKPALECNKKGTRNNKKGEITKLMKIKYANSEFKEIQTFKKLLHDIPDYSNYFLLDGFSLCRPDTLSEDDLTHFDKKCKSLKKIDITAENVNSSLDKLLSLNMPFGGVDIEHYVKKRMEYTKLHNMNATLIQLLQNGILPMNERGVFHCDIKDSNVLIKEEDSGLKTRLIDWGLSTTFAVGSHTIPKQQINRPFQFNVPFSVVLFNDTFTKMYAEFLKKNPDPSFYILRSFVINYVVTWVNKRGPGHLKALNNIFKKLFERGLVNIEETFKDDLIEFDFTFYFIFEYISQVLFKFTRNGSFQKIEYFTSIYLKNLDLWGYIMIYLPIIEKLEPYYKQLCDCEKKIIDTIRDLILYAIECSYVAMDPNKIVQILESLQPSFLQAERKSTIRFDDKESTSSSISLSQNKTKKKSNKTNTHSKTKTVRSQ